LRGDDHGRTADEWASSSPPNTATIPQGIPCTRLANFVVAASGEAKQPAANAQEHIAVDEARKYRQLAEDARDPLSKQELLELADVCDEVANNIEDRLTAG
jgi:hypothetical protein